MRKERTVWCVHRIPEFREAVIGPALERVLARVCSVEKLAQVVFSAVGSKRDGTAVACVLSVKESDAVMVLRGEHKVLCAVDKRQDGGRMDGDSRSSAGDSDRALPRDEDEAKKCCSPSLSKEIDPLARIEARSVKLAHKLVVLEVSIVLEVMIVDCRAQQETSDVAHPWSVRFGRARHVMAERERETDSCCLDRPYVATTRTTQRCVGSG